MVAVVAVAAGKAHAVEPPVVPVQAVQAPQRPDDLDARHRLGLQLGGSSFVQFVYRLRMFGHLYLEVGGGGAPEATLNGSLGLMVAHSTGTRVFPYAAAGVGFGSAAGPGDANPMGACKDDPLAKGCPWESSGVGYGYGRAGVGVGFGPERRLAVLFDLGVWVGKKYRFRDDGMGTTTDTAERFVWPMPGVAGIVSF